MSFVFRPITTVDFMSEVQRIDGILDFRATPLLSLRGMESVRQINSLALQEMRIASLAPLEALMTASGLISLRDLLELASLQGLQSLEEVADLRIENVPSVSSLEELESLRRVGNISIRRTGITREEFDRFLGRVEVTGSIDFRE